MLEEINQLLSPGYLPMETGYCRLPNGQVFVATLTDMPGCKSEWVEWWFGTHLTDATVFRQWDPMANLYLEWDKTWSPGKYIGSSHYAELLMAGKIFKFIFKYHDPAKFFDTSKLKEANIGSVICEEGFALDGSLDDRTIICIRNTDYGCEMRTRCWIYNGTDELGMIYMNHFISGMRNLAERLRLHIEESQNSSDRTNVSCKFCSSKVVVKNGISKNTQYWLCRVCGRGFINNNNLPKMKYSPEIIASSVNNYYAGISINNICRSIESKYNILPSTSTIYGWIKRLTEIALKEEKKYVSSTSDKWVIDETEIWLKGKRYWLINVTDVETHFILAVKLSSNKSEADIRSLLASARDKVGEIPKELFIKGGKEYEDGIQLAFGAEAKNIRISSLTHNQIASHFAGCWHGTLIERLKPWYGLNGDDRTQNFLDGFIFHHNFFRLNENLGSIPAQAARIDFPFKSWMDVIRNRDIPHT